MDEFSIIQDLVLGVVSALGGALFAFLFEKRRQRHADLETEYAALQFAHFALMQQYSTLVIIGDNYLKEAQENPRRWLFLRPLYSQLEVPQLNVSELLFIFRSKDPDLLNRMLAAQQKFLAFKSLVEQRNNLHFRLQERLGGIQKSNEIPQTEEGLDLLEYLIGQPLVGQLKVATEALYSSWRNAEEFLRESLGEVESFSKVQFPSERAPKFELLPCEERR